MIVIIVLRPVVKCGRADLRVASGSLAIVLFFAFRFKRLRYNLLPFVTDDVVAFPEKLLKIRLLEARFLA